MCIIASIIKFLILVSSSYIAIMPRKDQLIIFVYAAIDTAVG